MKGSMRAGGVARDGSATSPGPRSSHVACGWWRLPCATCCPAAAECSPCSHPVEKAEGPIATGSSGAGQRGAVHVLHRSSVKSSVDRVAELSMESDDVMGQDPTG